MGITPLLIASDSIQTNEDAIIDIVYVEPNPLTFLTTPEPPGKLIGYYNGVLDAVELYVVDGTGLRLLRV